MVSIFLIIVAVIIAVITLLLCILLLAKFVHPDDVSEAWVPKFITLFGLWLAFTTIIALPYDVANSRGGGGGLRIDILWQIIYVVDAIMLSFLIPFAFFFYESDDDQEGKKRKCCCFSPQFCDAVKYTFIFIFVFVLILVLFYVYLGTAEIPVERISQNTPLIVAGGNATLAAHDGCDQQNNCITTNFIWKIPVTFPIYIGAFLSFVGWWFFTIFVGVGLIALPMDLVNEWRYRPEPMSFQEYSEKRRDIGQRASYLLQAGLALQKEKGEPGDRTRRQKRSERDSLLKFEQAFYILKKDYEVLRISHQLKGGNPVWYFFKGCLGVIGIFISATWIIHICIFMIPNPPIHPFLNEMFIKLEEIGGGGFPLFGIAAFGFWAYYLLWCVVKGNFKLGIRLLCLKLYPMELNNTMMNSFLANTWVILLTSLPCLQFCVQAFPIYSRLSTVDLMLGTQAKYLKFFRYFWQNYVFVFGILAIAFLTSLYLSWRPNDVAAEIEKKIDAVQNSNDDDD